MNTVLDTAMHSLGSVLDTARDIAGSPHAPNPDGSGSGQISPHAPTSIGSIHLAHEAPASHLSAAELKTFEAELKTVEGEIKGGHIHSQGMLKVEADLIGVGEINGAAPSANHGGLIPDHAADGKAAAPLLSTAELKSFGAELKIVEGEIKGGGLKGVEAEIERFEGELKTAAPHAGEVKVPWDLAGKEA